jgi:hypothetical protein
VTISKRLGFSVKPKRSLSVLLAIAALGAAAAGTVNPGKAYGEAVPLEVKAEAGYQGKVKEDRWFPAQFTITNKGDDLSGELAVEVASPLSGKDVTYTVRVDLPKNSTKNVSLALPGMSFTDQNNRVAFYKGSAAKGTRMQIRGGDQHLNVQALPAQTYHVGVLARDPDTMNFIALLGQRGYLPQVSLLELDSSFEDSRMLDGLDAIVVNDFAASQWKPEHIKAVKAWVVNGGSLILGGGAGYGKTAAPFQDISPVEVSGSTALSRLDELAAAGGKELVLTEPFTVSRGTLRQGAETVLAEEGIPLVAKSRSGYGRVWYVAYDLSLQPVASWQGNAVLWEGLLQEEGIGQNSQGRKDPVNAPVGPAYWNISEGLEQFPSLAPPSVKGLSLVLILYACAVGPLLYLLLKRLDKREWAWVAIPGLAIAVSGCIYWSGASGRSDTTGQLMTIASLDGQGRAVERSAAAVFVPKGGTYNMEGQGSAYALSLGSGNNGVGSPGQMRGESDAFIQLKGESASIRLTGVPYWSIRKAWFYDEEPKETGSIGYKLLSDGSDWTGEFKNNLKTDLEELVLFTDSKYYELGSLKAGEKIPVPAAFQSNGISYNTPGSFEPFHVVQSLYPYRGQQDQNLQKRALISAFMEERMMSPAAGAYIIGWSKGDNKGRLKVNGSFLKAPELKLWVQPVYPEAAEGSVGS